jgi:hypothetical protein
MGGLEPPTQCARMRAKNSFAAQTRGGLVAGSKPGHGEIEDFC